MPLSQETRRRPHAYPEEANQESLSVTSYSRSDNRKGDLAVCIKGACGRVIAATIRGFRPQRLTRAGFGSRDQQ